LLDITERKQSDQARRKSDERYYTLFEDSRDAIIITTHDGRFIDVNKACLNLFGYTRDELMSMTVEGIYENPLARQKILEEIVATGSLRDYDVRLRRKDQTVMDCLLTITVWHDDVGNILGYQAIIRDVTEKKRSEETIWRLAYHDALTGLPNRLLYMDRLNTAIARAHRNGHKLSVMMLDLDRFKCVNDSLGHHIGDSLLQVVGERLKSAIRKGDTVSRIGGDEFMLLLAEIIHIKDASIIARKIINSFRDPFEFDGHRISITTSIGIAIYPDDGENADTLIQHADIAMYRVKETGRNHYKRFNPSMTSAVSP
jgi:diguanylate cyclase (GGDEF)-like protein/PAS domain S-box-containing protein